MPDDLERFLKEGLTKYPEAFKALKFFADTVGEKFAHGLRSKEPWASGFKLDGERALRPFFDGRPQDCWVSVTAFGNLNGAEVKLDMSIWWGSPVEQGRPILFVSSEKGLTVPAGFRPHNTVFKYAKVGAAYRLYTVLDSSSGLDGAVTALLEELDAAMSATAVA